MLENRRAIERLFLELDTGQNDVERALAEIASGDDATALDLRLSKLTEFVRQCHERCDGIEAASKTVASLKDAYAELRTRLAPFAAAKGGVTDRVKETSSGLGRYTMRPSQMYSGHRKSLIATGPTEPLDGAGCGTGGGKLRT